MAGTAPGVRRDRAPSWPPNPRVSAVRMSKQPSAPCLLPPSALLAVEKKRPAAPRRFHRWKGRVHVEEWPVVRSAGAEGPDNGPSVFALSIRAASWYSALGFSPYSQECSSREGGRLAGAGTRRVKGTVGVLPPGGGTWPVSPRLALRSRVKTFTEVMGRSSNEPQPFLSCSFFIP